MVKERRSSVVVDVVKAVEEEKMESECDLLGEARHQKIGTANEKNFLEKRRKLFIIILKHAQSNSVITNRLGLAKPVPELQIFVRFSLTVNKRNRI